MSMRSELPCYDRIIPTVLRHGLESLRDHSPGDETSSFLSPSMFSFSFLRHSFEANASPSDEGHRRSSEEI